MGAPDSNALYHRPDTIIEAMTRSEFGAESPARGRG